MESSQRCNVLWTWDESTTVVSAAEMQQVRLQLECNVITTVFPQAISTLRFSGPDLFTHVIISVPQAFIGRAQHELIPALRGVCITNISCSW